MTVATVPLVGREPELAALLAALRSGASAVLEAAPGMGKTSVMRALHEAGTHQDVAMLTARPTEPELAMAFSGLTDLLGDLPEEEYDALPAPQRSAVRVAVLLDDGEGETDPRAVAAGLRTLLRNLSARRPVVLVVDDAQWLDDATTTVLSAALRRLEGVPVSVVAASRPTGGPVAPWIAGETAQVQLAPLSAPALFQVIRSHLDVAVGRGRLLAIERASGGNPLYALEFARHDGSGADATFERLLGDRLRSLSRDTRLALLVAALAGDAPLELVASARDRTPGDLLDDLDPAVRAGLVVATSGVVFGHPLFAHAVVETAAKVDVEAAHGRLAAVATTAEARARHLARACSGTDAGLADQLAAAAEETRRRGGWASSIDLLELAADRTPDPARQAERAVTLAKWLSMGNRFDEAERWLDRARAQADGDTYWTATLDLCDLRMNQGRVSELGVLVEELAAADLPPLARCRYLVGYAAGWPLGTPASTTLERLRSYRPELAALPDCPQAREYRGRALATEGYLTEYLALGPSAPLWEEAVALTGGQLGDNFQSIDRLRAFQLFRAAKYDDSRAGYLACLAAAEERGDEMDVAGILADLATVELVTGRWEEAERCSRRAWEASLGQGEDMQARHEVMAAWLQGFRGDLAGALARLEPMVETDLQLGALHAVALHQGMIGCMLLAHGHAEPAYDRLVSARTAADGIECFDPTHLPVDDALVQAQVETGRWDDAAAQIVRVRDRAERIGRSETLESMRLWDVILTGARGDLDAAGTELPAELAHYDAMCPNPMNRGVAYLYAGRILRRARQKRLAHESLSLAVELFETLPCPPYAGQARAELARVGLRPRAPETLTESERRVAELASEGLRNKEIAERAFLSPKTVEAVLGRVYRKLGIRSRAELTRALDRVGD